MTMNYYDILSIKRDATLEEIQKAYKDKSFQFHPDFNNGISDDSMFRVIKEAYETLSDPDKRSEYDKTLNHNDPENKEKKDENTCDTSKQDLPYTEEDIAKYYASLNEEALKEPDKPSRFDFLKTKEWIFLFIIYSLVLIYYIKEDNPINIGGFGLVLAKTLGFIIGSLGITTVLALFKLIFRQRTSAKEFAYITIIILILGSLCEIL